MRKYFHLTQSNEKIEFKKKGNKSLDTKQKFKLWGAIFQYSAPDKDSTFVEYILCFEKTQPFQTDMSFFETDSSGCFQENKSIPHIIKPKIVLEMIFLFHTVKNTVAYLRQKFYFFVNKNSEPVFFFFFLLYELHNCGYDSN